MALALDQRHQPLVYPHGAARAAGERHRRLEQPRVILAAHVPSAPSVLHRELLNRGPIVALSDGDSIFGRAGTAATSRRRTEHRDVRSSTSTLLLRAARRRHHLERHDVQAIPGRVLDDEALAFHALALVLVGCA
jgi:hypothetical protein